MSVDSGYQLLMLPAHPGPSTRAEDLVVCEAGCAAAYIVELTLVLLVLQKRYFMRDLTLQIVVPCMQHMWNELSTLVLQYLRRGSRERESGNTKS